MTAVEVDQVEKLQQGVDAIVEHRRGTGAKISGIVEVKIKGDKAHVSLSDMSMAEVILPDLYETGCDKYSSLENDPLTFVITLNVLQGRIQELRDMHNMLKRRRAVDRFAPRTESIGHKR